MRGATIACALALVLGLAAASCADTPGFTQDLEQAKTAARDSGKSIFVYFSLPG